MQGQIIPGCELSEHGVTEGNWSGLFYRGCVDKRKETDGADSNLNSNKLEKMIHECICKSKEEHGQRKVGGIS